MTKYKEFDLLISPQKDFVLFNGMSFPCREVLFSGKERVSLIATESLENLLLTDESTYVNSEAQKVDDQIFFFVPDNVIHQSPDLIKNYVEACL